MVQVVLGNELVQHVDIALIDLFIKTSHQLVVGQFGFVAGEEPGFSPAEPRAIEGGFSRGHRG